MKYIVELKYTNPSHEHVSLRRRVESTSRLVEARSEEEAVFRASNQQKALGFFVTEAKATAVQEAAKKVDFMKFGKDFLSQKLSEAVSFGRSGGVMNYDPKTEKSEKPAKGVSALDKDGNLVGHYPDLETAKKLKPGHTYQTNKGVAKEEVEQIDEGKAHDRITAGLKDENPNVRVDTILHPKATPEHISIALKDEHPYVREAAIRHRNATPEHISAALKDDHMVVRKAAIKNRNASSENISAALKNGDIYTRMNAIKHRNVKPEHIAIALKDKDSYVRDAAKKRMKKEEVFTEGESIEEAKQVDHAKTIAKSLAATHPNFRVSSYDGDHGRAHVVHHKSDTRNFKNGEQLMGPNIQLQHNHKTNKVHIEMQGDYDNVPDRNEEIHHPDKAHEAAHKMFKPAIDLIHTTDKTTTNEEVELDEAQKKLKPSYWRAEWRMGTKSDVDKNNKKIYDNLVKTDPEKAAKFHDSLMKMRKEEVEQTDEALLPKQQAVADKLKASELAANKEKAGYKFGKSLRAAKVAAKMQKEETEVQYIEEKLTAADPASEWIKDFVASDNPKFAGKSKKERINMALGAYYAAKRSKNEATEKKYNEKEVKHDEKKQEKKKGSLNKVKMEPEMEISSQGVK